MKKSKIGLLLLSSLLLVGCGDDEETPAGKKQYLVKACTSYNADGSISEKTVYSYNDKDLLTKIETQLYDESSKHYSTSSYVLKTYDDEDRELSSELFRTNPLGEGFVSFYKEVSEYTNGKLSACKNYVPGDGGELVLDNYLSNYVYDSLGRLTSVSHYSLKTESTEFYLHYLDIYSYVDSFMEFSEEVQTFYTETGDEKEISNTQRELDETGRVVYEVSDDHIGDSRTAIFYSYDEFGNLINETYYDYDNENVLTIERFEDYFYKNGNCVEITITNFGKDGHPESLSSIVSEYDANGNNTKNLYYGYDAIEGDFVLQSYEVLEY